MSTAPAFLEFPDRESASEAAASSLADGLREALTASGEAGLVVSGGTSPRQCLRVLSRAAVEWSKVTVLPSDERWVPPDHPDSNEGMVRRQLLTGPAQSARWLPFHRPGSTPEEAAAAVEAELRASPKPLGAVLLGMGEDGHFASLFPDDPGLESALDPGSTRRCVVVRTAASPHPRISLTLSALLDSHAVHLLFFGIAKRRVFDSALNGDSRYPVSALIAQRRTPVIAFWAP